MMSIRKEMEALVDKCIELRSKERPEVQWLKKQYQNFVQRGGFSSKEAADKYIYEKMYGKTAEDKQDILKIRYWRTGRHLPAKHEQCVAFGKAMGMAPEELRFLLQGYYDSSDEVYRDEPADGQSAYWRRREVMERLMDQYLRRILSAQGDGGNITKEILHRHIRHLYYTDALRYVQKEFGERKKYLEKHIISINYDSEFNRNRKMLGTISRKTMIRHLIILGAPDISVEWINTQLLGFGYLPLQKQHTLRNGERLDWLLLEWLRRYEQFCHGKEFSCHGRESTCHGKELAECCKWLQDSCSILDTLLKEKGERLLRFMYFKALEN